MKAKKYFDKEYGNDHIKLVVDMKDLESLYGLMQEYTDEQLRLHIVNQQRELLLDFLSKVNGNLIVHPHLQMNSDFVDDYLKSNNCG